MNSHAFVSISGLLLTGLTLANGQPVIVAQPQDQDVVQGDTTVFSVEATGMKPITYQWRAYQNFIAFTNIPGATEQVLTLANVQPTDHRFAVEVSNNDGSVVSRLARLNVTPFEPPTLTAQPTNQMAPLGGTATFSVEATGFPPPAYQWRHRGLSLNEETNRNLSLTDLQLNQAGSYDVVLMNQSGSVTSQVAVLSLVKTLHPPYNPGLTVEKVGGQIRLLMTGEGHLESAPTPSGPWSAVGTFVVSTNLTFSEDASFYRVKNLYPRAVDVFIPSSFQEGVPLPLVIMLEGYVTTPEDAEAIWNIRPLAEKRGFLYCAPSGNTNSEGYTSWNGTDTCCNGFGERIDDVGFLASLIVEAAQELSADPKRIYLFGFSNGGAMAFRMACERPEMIAGLASYAGYNYRNSLLCRPSGPVNILHIFGTSDSCYSGCVTRGNVKPSAQQTLQMWADYNGCVDPVTESVPTIDFMNYLSGLDTIVTRYTSSPPGGEVEYWEIQNAVHAPDPTPTISGHIINWLLNRPKPD